MIFKNLLCTLFVLVVTGYSNFSAPAQGVLEDRGGTKNFDIYKEMILEDGYTSSRVCGECHEDIYRSWKGSLHALSLQDPIFDVAFMQALKIDSQRAKQLCLRCHAPVVMVTGDYELREAITTEGITCDFCHTVKEVDLSNPEMPYHTVVGVVKRSILRRAESPAHETAYSELHGKAEFCGGCHVYKSKSGAVIMGTYLEWLQGPYAKESIVCQDCHMQRSVGRRVRADIKESEDGMHLHDLIHDTNQLRSAVSVEVKDIQKVGNSLKARIEITNVSSGHMIPTGIPNRELELVVTLTSRGKEIDSARRIYKKVVSDGEGRVLSDVADIFLNGDSIVEDNRIGPKETRREDIWFPDVLSRRGPFEVSAELIYLYQVKLLDPRVIEIQMDRATRAVGP